MNQELGAKKWTPSRLGTASRGRRHLTQRMYSLKWEGGRN